MLVRESPNPLFLLVIVALRCLHTSPPQQLLNNKLSNTQHHQHQPHHLLHCSISSCSRSNNTPTAFRSTIAVSITYFQSDTEARAAGNRNSTLSLRSGYALLVSSRGLRSLCSLCTSTHVLCITASTPHLIALCILELAAQPHEQQNAQTVKAHTLTQRVCCVRVRDAAACAPAGVLLLPRLHSCLLEDVKHCSHSGSCTLARRHSVTMLQLNSNTT